MKRYGVAFLAGHGIGPEVTGEASRAVEAASRLHGFVVDATYVPFGSDAFVRFGHPYPMSSRASVLRADAVLVAPGEEDPLELLEAELDVRASVTRVRFDRRHELSVLAPLADAACEWTIERAFAVARASRARVAFAGFPREWQDAAGRAAAAHDGFEVEWLATPEAARALVTAPHRFDVVVAPPELAAGELAACTAADRVVAWGRLAGTGPSVFGAAGDAAHDEAGHGVADPRPLLLAAALMLGEGLGERTAAATLSEAVGGARRPAPEPSTRGTADAVLAALPHALGVEFVRDVPWA